MSIMVEFEAEIKTIGATEVFESGFQKRSIIVKLLGEKENPEYPTWLTVEAKKDNVIEFDKFQAGQTVSVKAFLSGNLWTPTDGRPEKAFVGLDLWKIKASGDMAPTSEQPQNYGGPSTPAPQIPQFDPTDDSDSIPFMYNAI